MKKVNGRYVFLVVIVAIFLALALTACWGETTPMPHPTSSYGFAQCPDDPGSIYIIGGSDEWDGSLDHFLRGDAATEIWQRLEPLPESVVAPAATCYDGRIYVVTYSQKLYIYDLAAGTWSEGSGPPRAVWGAAIASWDGRIYLVSGSAGKWNTPVSQTDIYDLVTDSWTTGGGPDIPTAVFMPGYVQTGPFLYVVGGFGAGSPDHNVDATQRLDMSSDSWELGPTFAPARAAFALAAYNQTLFAIGGDLDGGTYLDETDRVDGLYLSNWLQGSWFNDTTIFQPLMFNSSGYCVEKPDGYSYALTVGGAYPDPEEMNAVNVTYARDEYDPGASLSPEYSNVCPLGSFSMTLNPTDQSGAALPGQTITYTLNLANNGDIPDAYEVEVAGGWPVTVSPVAPLWAHRNESLTLAVTVPTTAQAGETDTATVTINSQGSPTMTVAATVTTLRESGVVLTPPTTAGEARPGELITYPFELFNGTDSATSFNLDLGPHAWTSGLSTSVIGPLPIGASTGFSLTVKIPPDAAWYLTDTVVITATAQTNPDIDFDTAVITTEAYAPPEISVDPLALSSTQLVGQQVTDTLTVSNGNGAPLSFYIQREALVSEAKVLLRLDEPAGAHAFVDSSGNGNHGYCAGTGCPTAGVPGVYGSALSFDGIDDFVEILHSSTFDDIEYYSRLSIGMWVKIAGWYNGYFVLTDKFESSSFGWDNSLNASGYWDFQARVGSHANCNFAPSLNEWYHLVLTYDRNNVGRVRFYINGTETCSVPFTSALADTDGEPLYLGYGPSGAPEYSHGTIDELFVFDRALTAEEVAILYYHGAGLEDAAWLLVEPISGTLPTNSSQTATVAFDAGSLQPSVYTTTLSVVSNDPLQSIVQVPVTMTVEATASMGWIEGVVTGVRTGEPLEAKIVASDLVTVTSRPDTGYYRLWLERGSHTLEVSAPGYETESLPVNVVAQQGLTQDVALLLDGSWLQLDPVGLIVTQTVGAVSQHTLIISNTGTQPLDFQVLPELLQGNILSMHLDEPAGSTVFHDDSGYGNNGTCAGTTCPAAGVAGRLGTALYFDGDDYVLVPDGPSLNPPSAIAIAAWVYAEDWNGNRRIVQKGNSDSQYRLTAEGGLMRFHLYSVGVLTSALPASGEWHHVLAQYDGTTMQIWIDGALWAETGASGSLVTRSDSLHIGTKYPGAPSSDYFRGWLDEVALYERALTPAEILLLVHGGGNAVPWLIVNPLTGKVPISDALPLEVTLDATGVQPGQYATAIHIVNNDPLQAAIQVPVTMVVEPTASMGWVTGAVSDLRTGTPLAATIVAQGQPYTVTSDVNTGDYRLWLKQGTYTLEVRAPGYVRQTATVTIIAQAGTPQSFMLLPDAPWLEITPTSLAVTQTVGVTATRHLTISNTGPASLDFTVRTGLEQPIRIVSDDSWRVSATLDPGWQTVSFDDSGWEFTAAPAPVNCGTINCWSDPDVFTMWSVEQHQAIYLRKSFVLGSTSQIISATVKSMCDDDHDLYINGTLVASDWNGVAGPTLITDIAPYLQSGLNVIAVKASNTAGGCRVMCIDANVTLEPSGWLQVNPISGTVPAFGSLPVEVTFDAVDLQPGTYAATMQVLSNDPLAPIAQITVTMTAESTPDMGWIEGTVSGLGYCDGSPAPLVQSTVEIAAGSGLTWTTTTDENGAYLWWLQAPDGPYTVTAAFEGHTAGAVSGVVVAGQQGTTADLDLRWLMPCLSLSPESLSVILWTGLSQTVALTVDNTGAAPLTFQVIARQGSPGPPENGQAVELAIPDAPQTPPAGSAVAAGPYTPRPERLITILPYPGPGPRVLLLHADDGDGDFIRSQLLAYSDLEAVDAYDATAATPTLTDLLPYDVVVTWANYEYDDPAAVGDLLADYVDAGGRVINTLFALGNSGWEMEGRFMGENYTAMSGGTLIYEEACVDESLAHPIYFGVQSLCDYFRLSDTTLTAGSTAIARYADDEIAIAAKDDRSVVTLAAYPGYYFLWTGDLDRVIHNSILWQAGGAGLSWLTIDPEGGTADPGGGSVALQVTFNAAGLAPGQYSGYLLLLSNDPQRGVAVVPIHMIVGPGGFEIRLPLVLN